MFVVGDASAAAAVATIVWVVVAVSRRVGSVIYCSDGTCTITSRSEEEQKTLSLSLGSEVISRHFPSKTATTTADGAFRYS